MKRTLLLILAATAVAWLTAVLCAAESAVVGAIEQPISEELKAPEDPTILKRRIWSDTEWNIEAGMDDPLRQGKLSPMDLMDLPSRSKWFDYSRAGDIMLKAKETKWAPWYILRSDDKKRARLNCIHHFESNSLQESFERESEAA